MEFQDRRMRVSCHSNTEDERTRVRKTGRLCLLGNRHAGLDPYARRRHRPSRNPGFQDSREGEVMDACQILLAWFSLLWHVHLKCGGFSKICSSTKRYDLGADYLLSPFQPHRQLGWCDHRSEQSDNLW